MRSAGSVAPKRASPQGRVSLAQVTLARGAESALFLAVAASVAFAGRESAGYDAESWAPLGLALVALCGGLLLAGRRPSRSVVVGSSALAVLAVWAGVSPAWGGVPNQAWTVLNQSVLAAAALVAGSQLGSTARRRALLLLAVLAGVVAQALEILIRLAAEPSPIDWFTRGLQGPVGYTNGQAAVLTVGIPLALWLVGERRALLRAAGGAASGLLVGALLLTQSRGALIAVIAAVLIQAAWTRRIRLLLFVAPLTAAAVGLGFDLRAVDEAVLVGDAAEQLATLREYVLWTAAAALGLGAVAAAPAVATRLRQPLTVAAVALLAAGLAVAGVAARSAVSDAVSAVTSTPADRTEFSAAGTTRLLNVGFGGRRDTWRIAADMVADAPLSGAGPGEFARQWTIERRLTNLYVLQPHSIEMELLSELGIVGLGLFVVFSAAVVAGALRVRDRALGAVAIAVFVLLVVHASVDLMWSLAGVVATTLFVVGAAIGSPRRFRLPLAKKALVALGAAALMISFVAPYLAERQLARAQDLERSDPARAERNAEAASRLNPWDSEPLSLQGRVAEALGDFERAADRYHSAAENSRIPWLESFREARALSRAGEEQASRAACRRALRANPAEELLLAEPCGADAAVNAWPVVRVNAAGPPPSDAQYDAFFKDDGCGQCSLAFVGSELAATIAGGSDAFDTAYGLKDFGGPAGWPVRVYTRDVVRLEDGQKLSGNLPILQIRDVRNELVAEIYIHEATRTIRLWSPPGGLHSNSLNEDTGVVVPADGVSTRVVEVSALADETVVVRVDGKALIKRDELSGSTSGPPRFLRVGITAYTESIPERVRVYHRSVDIRRNGWLGLPKAPE